MGTIQSNLAGFPLGIVLRFRNAPNLNIPAIYQEISVPAVLKWQSWLIFMGYSMLMQPVINSLLIGRADKMPIIASKSDATIKPIRSNRNTELFAQSCDRFRTYTVLDSNLVKGHAHFKVHLAKFFLSWVNDFYAFATCFPYARASNLMLFQPMSNGGTVNTIHLTYLIITAMFYMNKAFQFVFGRFLDAPVKQAAISSTRRDIVELQPTKDFSLAHVELTSNLARRKALSDIETIHGFIVRAAMACRSKGTHWKSLDVIVLKPIDYGATVYSEALSNLLLRQALGLIEVTKGLFIGTYGTAALLRAIACSCYMRRFAVKRFTAPLASYWHKGTLTVFRSLWSSVWMRGGKQGKLNRVVQWGHSDVNLLNRFASLGLGRATNTLLGRSISPHYTTQGRSLSSFTEIL